MVLLGTISEREIYQKGIAMVAAFDSNDNCIDASGVAQTASLAVTSDKGEIRAGLSNPIVMQISSNTNMAFTAAFANSSLGWKKINLGADLGWGAPIPQNMALTLSPERTFTLPAGTLPVLEIGSRRTAPIARVDGIAYDIIDTSGTLTVSMPTGVVGKTYCVTWFVNSPSSKLLKIKSQIVGEIVRLVVTAPLYAKPIQGATSQSTEIGMRFYHIPTAQADGTDTSDLSQDATNVTNVVFTALPYTEMVTADNPCISATTYLAYYQDLIYEDSNYGAATGIFVKGNIDVDEGETAIVPVMMTRATGTFSPVTDVADFDFTLNPSSLGTVSTAGQVARFTGGSQGTGTLTVKGKSNPVTTTMDLSALEAIQSVTVNIP